jgi:hypothetical protein
MRNKMTHHNSSLDTRKPISVVITANENLLVRKPSIFPVCTQIPRVHKTKYRGWLAESKTNGRPQKLEVRGWLQTTVLAYTCTGLNCKRVTASCKCLHVNDCKITNQL